MTEFKATVLNSDQEFKEFKEDTKFSLITEDYSRYLGDIAKNTNIQLHEMIKTIWDLKSEFSKLIEILRTFPT